MKNQDPTNPMQNNELTTQLAQISTVQGVEKLNETVSGLTGQLNPSQALNATKLVGKGVMVAGNKINLFEKQNAQVAAPGTNETLFTPFGFELIRPADKVTLTISDKTGRIVKTIEHQQEFKADVYHANWDGKDNEGNQLPVGSYQFTVTATAGQEQVYVKSLNYALVNGVTKGEQGVLLDVGLGNSVSLDEIRQVL